MDKIDVRALLKTGIAQLRDAGVPSFTLAAELLLLHTMSCDRTWLYAHPEEPISTADAARFLGLIARRAAGEPTQYIVGTQEFWGLEFDVTPDVLIPRPETEHLIEVALDRLALREIRAGRLQRTAGKGLLIADVGTGSGCIAIVLAKELGEATIVATDISATALEVARRNATHHGVAGRIDFLESNLLDSWSPLGAQPAASLPGTICEPLAELQPVMSNQSRFFDLVVSNPPYIGRRDAPALAREVREHEPELALYGGREGYEFYADLIAQGARYLKRGGILVVELGYDSLPAVEPLLDTSAWANVGITNDLAGIPRVIAAERL
jgi:release factor glutamine methyltransferase